MKTDNEIIAEFMGLTLITPANKAYLPYYREFGKDGTILSDHHPKSGGGGFKSLRYDTSWDRLMPVVEKISSLSITPAPNYKGYRIEIVTNGYVRISGFPMPTLTTNVSIEGSLIAAVYRAVVEFIKFYNEQPK